MKLSSIIILLLVFLFHSCTQKHENIEIAFNATLTGLYSNPGLMARNGFLLAVEDAQNDDPYFSNKSIVTVIQDNQFNQSMIHDQFETLIHQGKIKGVVGPLTSTMAMAIEELFPQYEKKGIPIISPTVSSDHFSKKRDAFITLNINSYTLAEHINKVFPKHFAKYKRIGIVTDLANKTFSNSLKDNIHRTNHSNITFYDYPFGDENHTISQIQKRLKDDKIELVILIAGSYHSALILQQFKKHKYKPQIILTQWALEEELVAMAGNSVENAYGIMITNINDEPSLNTLASRYRARFGTNPTYISIHAYEATQALLNALKSEVSPFAYLINKNHRGVANDFFIDQQGDVNRKLYLIQIRNGRFITIE